MNKNSIKKCWRQLDEACEAIERLMDNKVISYNHYDIFEDIVSLKNHLETYYELKDLK